MGTIGMVMDSIGWINDIFYGTRSGVKIVVGVSPVRIVSILYHFKCFCVFSNIVAENKTFGCAAAQIPLPSVKSLF